jgi:hypothetical protein
LGMDTKSDSPPSDVDKLQTEEPGIWVSWDPTDWIITSGLSRRDNRHNPCLRTSIQRVKLGTTPQRAMAVMTWRSLRHVCLMTRLDRITEMAAPVKLFGWDISTVVFALHIAFCMLSCH